MIKASIKQAVIAWHKYRSARLYGDPGYVLLLSHMRSYSSLVSHILGSHPEISGHFEQHRSYTKPEDLDHLHWWSATRDTRLASPARLLYDKVLHNQYLVSREVLLLNNVHGVFLVRDPVGTLVSIANHFPDWDETRAVDYYSWRLEGLTSCLDECRAGGYEPLVLLAEDLLDDTSKTLATLTSHLKLSSPLSEAYELFSNTGTGGAGDNSQYIFAGRIVRSRNHEEVRLSDGAAERASRAYQLFISRCRQES